MRQVFIRARCNLFAILIILWKLCAKHVITQFRLGLKALHSRNWNFVRERQIFCLFAPKSGVDKSHFSI